MSSSQLRAHLDKVAQQCDTDISQDKIPTPTHHRTYPPWNPPPDFVLSVPNPLLQVINLACVGRHMISSRSVHEPLTFCLVGQECNHSRRVVYLPLLLPLFFDG